MDLGEWLKGLGLDRYSAVFAENDIDFDLLGQLTDDDLKDLGVTSFGNRKRLLAAIAERNAKPLSACGNSPDWRASASHNPVR